MNDVKISIFTPVFNGEYSGKCLDGILSQTISEFELYIHDDESTDNSYEICQKYATQNSSIRLYRAQRGTGLEAMKNFIEWTEGKYIAFVDNDDYLDDDYIANLYNEAERTDADCVVGSYTLIDAERSILPWYTPELKKGELLHG